jgi:multiple sugar transport system ATP-binding protein
MATLSIENISKRFGNTQVLHEINLDLADGEFLVLVGPSGCGKSTLMNIVAGLEEPSTGKLQLAGRDITHLEPDERDVAMVFQSYALYPNMTVAQNIAFPLEMRKVPKPEREKAVGEVAQMLQIGHLLGRKPRQLSGGQRQRVAIGRALARSPSLFLFDEPLSNLDAKLRVDMRAELKKLHMSTGVTTIYVTHDQVEAMTLGTRIAVLKDGLIQQLATPMALYNRPANLFVAGFIGSPAINLADGTVDEQGLVRMAGVDTGVCLPQHAGKAVKVGVRPEDLLVKDSPTPDTLAAKVTLVEPTGAESYVLVGGAFGEFTIRHAGEATCQPGAPLHLAFSADKVHVFDASTGLRLN